MFKNESTDKNNSYTLEQLIGLGVLVGGLMVILTVTKVIMRAYLL